MTKEELLKINDREIFEEELIKISEEYEHNLEKWDEDLIKHYLKLADMSMQEFKNSFDPYYLPPDYEDEMDKNY